MYSMFLRFNRKDIIWKYSRDKTERKIMKKIIERKVICTEKNIKYCQDVIATTLIDCRKDK